jgi:hypothetical protein
MIHGMFFSHPSRLGFERANVSDHVADRVFVRKRARHRAHQSSFSILGVRASDAAPEFSQLGGEVPVIDSCNSRRSQVLIAGAVVTVACAARRV